jgi:type VI secretion system protein ImpA
MLDLESLLAPLSDDAPSGTDLEYDPSFLELEKAGVGRAEQQYGDTVIAAEPPDWRTVREHALALAKRTRDLRVAVWLARCGARLDGFAGAISGLRLIEGLLSTRWLDVHPQLDASDGNDPTMRMNALAPLVADAAMLADLRAAPLTSARGSLTVRDVELGMGLAEGAPDEAVPTEGGMLEGLRACLEQVPELADDLKAGPQLADGIARILDEQLGGATGPDLQPLIRLLRGLDTACRRAGGESTRAEAAPTQGSADSLRGTGEASGAIASRDDVVHALDRLCEWIERHEPSNPAPLLLRRAQRLMSKSFLDIVRDLAPESLVQIEKLAGIESGSG